MVSFRLQLIYAKVRTSSQNRCYVVSKLNGLRLRRCRLRGYYWCTQAAPNYISCIAAVLLPSGMPCYKWRHNTSVPFEKFFSSLARITQKRQLQSRLWLEIAQHSPSACQLSVYSYPHSLPWADVGIHFGTAHQLPSPPNDADSVHKLLRTLRKAVTKTTGTDAHPITIEDLQRCSKSCTSSTLTLQLEGKNIFFIYVTLVSLLKLKDCE